MDREKVIEGLRRCTEKAVPDCFGCPYSCHCEEGDTWVIKDDVLTLLKEQDAVEPKKTAYKRVDRTIAYLYRCGMCDMSIFPSYKYCPFCGQAVKWE